jgi:hypothetical protein
LAVALVAALTLVTGCGSGDSTDSAPSATPPSSATTSSAPTTRTNPPAKKTNGSPCIRNGSYGGLYSPKSAFETNNNPTEPTVRTNGIAWYKVLSSEHGCVAGYSVDEIASPSLGASDIMFLVQGINLPDDRNDVQDKGGCSVLTSATLAKASGYKYAVVTGIAQQGQVPAHAEIHLANDRAC